MSEKKAVNAPKPAANGGASAPEKSPDEIRGEIEETRGELGDTVAAVAEKTDVKAQAKSKVDDVRSQASAKADETKLKAKDLSDRAKAAAPKSPAEGAQQAQRLAKENPTPLAIAAAVIGVLVLWRLLRR